MSSLASFAVPLVGGLLMAQNSRNFPADDKPLRNKSGRYELFMASDENRLPPHTLYVRDVKSGKIVEAGTFDRSVDVSWSDRENRFFLNDRSGSNRTTCRAAEISSGDSLQWLDLKVSPNRQCESSDATDHCYLRCIAWTGPGTIRGEFEYYGDQGRMQERVVFTIEE